MFRSLWIDGNATFTIVASRMTMNCATQTRQRTSHGLLFRAVTVRFYQTAAGLRFSRGQETELDPGGAPSAPSFLVGPWRAAARLPPGKAWLRRRSFVVWSYVTERKRPRRNWIQEERRKTLGDYTCFCLDCGSVWRYFLDGEAELPAACPHCGGETRHRCPECSAPFPSAFAVECEECGAAIRPPEVLGVRIRKPGR